MKKLLVVGGSGLTGFKIVETAVRRFETFATYNTRKFNTENCHALRLDKTNRDATFSLMERVHPDIVIDTTGLNQVDYCEVHQDEAWRVNVEGTRNVAEACRRVGAKLVFVSTDYLFDGKKGFYNEESPPHPLNYYGKTKLEAERIVRETVEEPAIARPSVIYGWNPPELAGLPSSSKRGANFVVWAIGKLEAGEEISIVTDQYNSPTLVDNLAEALLGLSEMEKGCVYHTAGKSCINRFEFAKKVAEIFRFDERLIKPITSDELKQVAERPKRCCLDVSKVERELGIKFLTIEEGLKRMKEQNPPSKAY